MVGHNDVDSSIAQCRDTPALPVRMGMGHSDDNTAELRASEDFGFVGPWSGFAVWFERDVERPPARHAPRVCQSGDFGIGPSPRAGHASAKYQAVPFVDHQSCDGGFPACRTEVGLRKPNR